MNDVAIISRTTTRGSREEFELWQRRLGQVAAAAPGFLDQTLLPPHPPERTHWVSLQWFANEADALAWLGSDNRRDLLASAPSELLDPDDVHIVRKNAVEGAGASAIITATLKPGKETEYREWQRRIATATARSRGFRGYQFEPPIAGVQDGWLVVIRYDTDADLRAWMGSPVRLALLKEAEPLTESVRIRIADAGLEQWFRVSERAVLREAWKMSMLVLLVLYPVVFLFDKLVAGPLFVRQGMPSWLAMFVGNVCCVCLLAVLVPWAGRRFRWWLEPPAERKRRIDLLGLAAVIGCYVLWLAIFAAASQWLATR